MSLSILTETIWFSLFVLTFTFISNLSLNAKVYTLVRTEWDESESWLNGDYLLGRQYLKVV
jgi:hypothetical protein